MVLSTDINLIGGLLGGLLIGSAALLLLLFNGKIAGISGIASQLLFSIPSRESAWRLLFIIGLIAGAGLVYYSSNLNIQLQTGPLGLAMAGFLVGLGTKLGSGCTSGHGVCGMARRSPRSFAATATFMLVAVLTATLIHGVWR